MAQDLLDAGLGSVEVMLEYRLPLTSKRADVILAGRHPTTGYPSYVVIELKQWSMAEPYDDSGGLVSVPGVPGGARRHPVAQVRDYCTYLVDFTKTLHDQADPIAGAAYLHNAGADLRHALGGYPQTSTGRLFTGADRGDFVEFLRSRLEPGVSGAPYADQLLRSGVSPSRQLLKVAAEEIAGREQFVLLDEQVVAVDTVLHAVEVAHRGDQKSVIVITGGPGSGKSVIALSLLGKLAERGRTVLHATGSRSFTMTLRKVSGRNKSAASTLFKYFNQFSDAERNGLDVLILDEAHRIRATSDNRYTKAALRTGTPQMEELLAAARVPVFLLDQHQVVRPGEMGTVEEITAHASAAGIPTIHISLDAQFRCGGSERYISWVEQLLGLRGDRPVCWEPDPPFHLDVVDSPDELEGRLSDYHDEGYGARMAAGYCWPWSDPRTDGSLVPD
ncbi:MAG: DNA/RNA helicase domain-containing protein, partial [Nakamurella sp.]